MRLSRLASVANVRRGLLRLLADSRPDVVVTHGPWVHSVFGPAVREAHFPLVLFLHSPPAARWLDLLARWTTPHSVIVNSKFTLSRSGWWIRGVPAFVCTYPFKDSGPRSRTDVRAELGIPAETVVVLQASRLDPYKGHRLHLEALSRLKANKNWHALFVGATQRGHEGYLRSLERQRERLGLGSRVRFLGHRTDVDSLMGSADVFCHPNIAPEPFGLVFVEAMHAGIPVVATRFGGAEEILAQGGGRLVLPEAQALAGALTELIADPHLREELGRAGRCLARSRYTAERGVRDLAGVLAGVLGGAAAL